MTSHDIKKYIIENNKVQDIVHEFGCHGFKEHKKEYRCGLPNDSNTTKVAINKESLKVKIFKPTSEIVMGDIFTLYMDIFDTSFVNANKFVHKILGLTYKWKTKDKSKAIDPLDIFKKVKEKSKFNVSDIDIYNEDIFADYLPFAHIKWIREGIMPYTCKEFNIGYSFEQKRIIIPHRYWCGDENEYLGIMGRTTNDNFDMLEIPKYLALKPFPKSVNLYGLQENYKPIQEAGYVVVAESEKAVLKRHSLLDRTVVALCSHNILDEQVRILIGLNVEIIIAMDKDIPLSHVKMECNKFYNIRKVSYIWDNLDLLKPKESPMDARNVVYKYLLNNRIPFDKEERQKYIDDK